VRVADEKQTIEVSLDQSLIETLDRMAQEQGESRSALVARACEHFVATRPGGSAGARVAAYIEGYRRQPEDPALAEVAVRQLGEVLEEESW
jgi:metal-responsive CopG/Arc/MetJ family transcriptional regulator